MTIRKLEEAGGTALELTGTADLRDASALRDALAECLAAGRPATLDASGLDNADAPSLQLISAALRDFRSRGVPFEIRPGRGPFDRAWTDAGFAPPGGPEKP